MTRARLSIVLCTGLSLIFACNSNNGTEAGSSATETEGDGDGDPTAGDGDGDTGDGDGDGDGDGGDGDGEPTGDGDGEPPEGCGNGVIEGDEECDDGDDNGEFFACLADCTLNVCGDGFVGPEEGCDDGNTVSDDGCSADCLLEDVAPGVVLCGNKMYECGDTIDNDQDGKIDLADPECISPCDDSEASFETNLPGQNKDCKGDCYFDANSGGGDDKCEWNLKCDPQNPGAEIGCAYDPNFGMCNLQVPQQCYDFCGPLVPNGCDCFGCCEINGQPVYLGGANCSLDNLAGCASCTYFENCINTCEPENCELCFGQTIDDLPDHCMGASCPEGVTSCASIADCPNGQFCQTGCCVDITPQ
jgi:cysteine-rich repeat protein